MCIKSPSRSPWSAVKYNLSCTRSDPAAPPGVTTFSTSDNCKFDSLNVTSSTCPPENEVDVNWPWPSKLDIPTWTVIVLPLTLLTLKCSLEYLSGYNFWPVLQERHISFKVTLSPSLNPWYQQ